MVTKSSAKYNTVIDLHSLLSTYSGIYVFNPTNSNKFDHKSVNITKRGGVFALARRFKCFIYVRRRACQKYKVSQQLGIL